MILHVEHGRRSVDGYGQFLAGQMSCAHCRIPTDVDDSQSIGRRPEMEGTSVEDAVDGDHHGPPVRGHGGQGQESHAGQAVAHLVGAKPSVRSYDLTEMGPGGGVAPIQEGLKALEILVAFEHGHSPLQALTTRQGRQLLTETGIELPGPRELSTLSVPTATVGGDYFGWSDTVGTEVIVVGSPYSSNGGLYFFQN